MKAVNNCKKECFVSIYASDATVSWLEELGYKVEVVSEQREGTYTKIFW